MTRTSPAFALADDAVEQIAALDPVQATECGMTAYDHLLPDYGPDGIAARRAQAAWLAGSAQSLVGQTEDPLDLQALQVLIERLDSSVALIDAGFPFSHMDVLTAPPFAVRSAFELMPPDADTVGRRLTRVTAAMDSWREALLSGVGQGHAASVRQVAAVVAQMRQIGAGWYTGFAERNFAGDRAIATAAADAEASYLDTADWLEATYSPLARTADGVGSQAYQVAVMAWLGDTIEPLEVYQWGWEELRTLVAQARIEADRVLPGADLRAAAEHLQRSGEHTVEGTDALVRYLEGVTREGFAVADEWFDIDPRIRVCEVRLAGAGSAAAPYYTVPSEDLSRPGATWFPTLGRERFHTWQLRSIWFHEAVPGHHLQLATVLVERDRLSRFQRLLGWTSGYGEGWALYAERLMDELGAFDTPASRLGFLSGQVMRAARVVVDIGLHLGLRVPADNGLGLPWQQWTPDLAVQVMQDFALLDQAFARSEVDRYLGLPGQAISYKVGERVWLEQRDEASRRLGSDFDLRDWHMTALRAGHMGLGPFRSLMSGYRR